MTAPLCDVELEKLSIGCEECQCEAMVMARGCSEHFHHAVCQAHFDAVVQRFTANAGALCDCGRPFLSELSTHYDVVRL